MRTLLSKLLICFALLSVIGGTASGHVVVPNGGGTAKPRVATRTAGDINFYKDEDLSLRSDWTPDLRQGRTPYGNSVRHWNDHGSEFPELRSYNDYVGATHEFLKNPPSGTHSFIRPNGDIMRYEPATNTFGVLRADGQPRTMFRPESPTYWELQLKKYEGGQ